MSIYIKSIKICIYTYLLKGLYVHLCIEFVQIQYIKYKYKTVDKNIYLSRRLRVYIQAQNEI